MKHLAICLSALCLTVPAAAQTLSVSLGADIRNTNPGVDRDDATDGVISHMVEGLVGYRESGEVAPLLAESYAISDDGLTYTFKLRQNLKFHNGDPVTSADVLWSWNRYLDPKTNWSCLSSFDGRNGSKVTDISAPDASTVVMKLEKRSAIFLTNMAQTDCGGSGILSKASLNADGSWNAPIGTGPFKLTEWRRGQFIQLARNDAYVSPPGDKADGYVGKKTPSVASVRYVIIPDLATAKAALVAGSLDVANIPETDIKEMEATGKVQIVRTEVRVRRSLLIQTRDPVLGNKKVRQAISQALDINEIVAATSNNVSKPNNSLIDPGSPYYSAAQRAKHSYNLENARRLLKEGGYTNQPITILTDKRPTVPMYNMALFAQQMMQAAGMNVNLEVVDFANSMNRYYAGKFQILAFSYSSRLDPSLSFEQIVGSKDAQPWKLWDDPAVAAKVRASVEELDPAKRQVIFDELNKQMLDEVPLVVLYNGVDIKAVGNRVKNFTSWEFKPRLWTARIDG